MHFTFTWNPDDPNRPSPCITKVDADKPVSAAQKSTQKSKSAQKKSPLLALLIDPVAKTVTEVQVTGDDSNLADIYEHLDCQTFDCVERSGNGDAIYVDDEGILYDPKTMVKRGFFSIGTQGQPYAGRGLWIGSDIKTGDSADCVMTLEQALQVVKFITAEVVNNDDGERVVLYR